MSPLEHPFQVKLEPGLEDTKKVNEQIMIDVDVDDYIMMMMMMMLVVMMMGNNMKLDIFLPNNQMLLDTNCF